MVEVEVILHSISPIYSGFASPCVIAKAYLQKKGTTTMKCASSAEADVFVQAVELFIAVISQIVRRCDLLCRVTSSDGNNRFRNLTLGYSDRNVIRESHLPDLQEKKRGAHVPENIVPIRD